MDPLSPISHKTVLGQGGFGTVKAYNMNGKLRALKIGKLGPLEVRISSLRSKYTPTYVAHNKEFTRLATKIAPRKLERTPHATLSTAIFLCDALADVNEKNSYPVVHRDIKFDNILVSKKGKLKLIDWGLAIPSGSLPERNPAQQFIPPGTPGCIPPEAFLPDNPINEKFDSWAIGLVMYQLLSGGTHPLDSPEGSSPRGLNAATALLQLKKSKRVEFKEKIATLPRIEGIPEEVYNVMARLLEPNPALRLSPSEASSILKSITPPSPEIPLGTRPSGDSPGLETAYKVVSVAADYLAGA